MDLKNWLSFHKSDPLAEEHAIVAQLLGELKKFKGGSVEELENRIFAGIVSLDRPGQARIVGSLTQHLLIISQKCADYRREHGKWSTNNASWRTIWQQHLLLTELLTKLMRKKLPLSEPALNDLLQWAREIRAADSWGCPETAIVSAAENYAAQSPLSATTVEQLRSFQAEVLLKYSTKEYQKLSDRISVLLGNPTKFPIDGGEAWSDAALAHFATLPAARQAAWEELLTHCTAATAASPSAKWLKAAAPLLVAVGSEEFKQAVLAWFPLVALPRTGGTRTSSYVTAGLMFITDGHQDILRGLAWLCGVAEDRELARTLTALAIATFKKGRGQPLSVRVGNACVVALGIMPGLDAVGQLALLKVKVKFGTAQIALEKALNIAAERVGLPREEIEEMSVPAYGLTEVGRVVETFGEFTAELIITGSKTAEIIWRRADGTVQKSVPAAVKQEFAEDVQELNAAKKDIEKMLPAQAERIDSLFLQQKRWPLETWLERYLEHPLVGTLARRLIWNFTTGDVTTPALWLRGKLVDRRGHPISLDATRTTVTLWHPLDQAADVVLGWRAFLQEWEVSQPFKQAHREVYPLTPAEERTRIYSNRFAAHLLKQHQFNALCTQRGWRNKLRLMVDDQYPPASRKLPLWGLRAEFWIEGTGDPDDTTTTGSYLHVSTDQVRFYPIDTAQVVAHAGGGGYQTSWRQPLPVEPLPLTEVPALVFSEIMRDVDLFVGVCSVGNDPTWADGGRPELERTAWTHFSFGELTATAKTRYDLLEQLVPKLKIASRCSLADRFLIVRGDLRTYKIHLGSGNILMSPNDQYLCIVPGTNERAKVFLPFEGDRTLSVILSKAFLLAADTKITDLSITRQIRA